MREIFANLSNETLLLRSKAVQEDILRDLQVLVNIDSPSGYSEGLTALKTIITNQLAALGAALEVLPTLNGGYNIIATLTGGGENNILLLAHADTVFPVGTAPQRPFHIKDGKAYGPGVCDDKAAVVMAIYALKLLRERNFSDFGKITLLINSDEEICSVHSRDLIKTLAQQHHYAICLESGGINNEIVSWRKGSARATIEVHGKASHAGSSPEKGRNALVELAHQVLQITTLANKEKETSVSVTVFNAGEKINVIPAYAVAQIDIRAKYQDELDRIAEAGAKIAKQNIVPGTQVTFTFIPNRPAFPTNPDTDALAEKVKALYQEIGLDTTGIGTGGGSDGNWTSLAGTPTIDGMSFIGGNAHTDEEYLELETMPARLYVLTRLLIELSTSE